MSLDVDGKEPGDEIHLTRPQSLNIRVRVQSPLVPVTVVELIVNGVVAATAKPARGGSTAELDHTLSVDRSSWIAARVWGNSHALVLNGTPDPRTFAHTSPVYCYVNEQKIGFPADAKVFVAWIDQLIADVKASPRFSSETKRVEVVELFRKAQKYYQDIASH